PRHPPAITAPLCSQLFLLFFLNVPAPPEIYTLSLHDALPISFQRRDLYGISLATLFLDAIYLPARPEGPKEGVLVAWGFTETGRSEEHTSELQSRGHLVCRLLLEKKKENK